MPDKAQHAHSPQGQQPLHNNTDEYRLNLQHGLVDSSLVRSPAHGFARGLTNHTLTEDSSS